MYKGLIQPDVPVDNNKKIRKMKIPLKNKVFAWYLRRAAIFTKDNLMLGLCRTGTFTKETKASVPGWPIVVVSRNPAYRAAQYDEAQEAHPAEGRFQKAACIAEDLALKASPKPG